MLQYFWDAKETIPDGVGFDLFGPLHLGWLAASALLYIVMWIWYRKQDENARRRCLKVVAFAMLGTEIVKQAVLVISGVWRPNYLPLHLCSFSIYFSVWHAVRPNKLNSELLYSLSFIGALMALLFCNWTMLPFWNFHHIQSFVTHILIVLYPILLLAGGYRPNYRMLPKCLLVVVALAIPLYFINKLLNSNFMFLNWADVGNPLSFFEARWGRPWYIFGAIPMLAVVWAVMYLPWGLSKPKNKKQKD